MKKNKAMLQRYDFFIFEIHRSMLKGDGSLLIDLKEIKNKESSLETLDGKDVFKRESLESYLEKMFLKIISLQKILLKMKNTYLKKMS